MNHSNSGLFVMRYREFSAYASWLKTPQPLSKKAYTFG